MCFVITCPSGYITGVTETSILTHRCFIIHRTYFSFLGNGLSINHGWKFIINFGTVPCSNGTVGGWWFKYHDYCLQSNLNGLWQPGQVGHPAMYWIEGHSVGLRKTSMKLRKKIY